MEELTFQKACEVCKFVNLEIGKDVKDVPSTPKIKALTVDENGKLENVDDAPVIAYASGGGEGLPDPETRIDSNCDFRGD